MYLYHSKINYAIGYLEVCCIWAVWSGYFKLFTLYLHFFLTLWAFWVIFRFNLNHLFTLWTPRIEHHFFFFLTILLPYSALHFLAIFGCFTQRNFLCFSERNGILYLLSWKPFYINSIVSSIELYCTLMWTEPLFSILRLKDSTTFLTLYLFKWHIQAFPVFILSPLCYNIIADKKPYLLSTARWKRRAFCFLLVIFYLL